jgi:hypothetical protein
MTIGLGSGYASSCHGAGRIGQRGVRRVGAASGNSARALLRLCRLHYCGAGGWCRRVGFRVVRRTQEQAELERGYSPGKRRPDRTLRRTGACASQLRHRPDAYESAILSRRGGNDVNRSHYASLVTNTGRSAWFLGVLLLTCVPALRYDALPVATPYLVAA